MLDFDLGPGVGFGVDFCVAACDDDFFDTEGAGAADDLGDGLATLFVDAGTETVIFLRVVFGFALPNMTGIRLCPDLKLKRRNEDYHAKDRRWW